MSSLHFIQRNPLFTVFFPPCMMFLCCFLLVSGPLVNFMNVFVCEMAAMDD